MTRLNLAAVGVVIAALSGPSFAKLPAPSPMSEEQKAKAEEAKAKAAEAAKKEADLLSKYQDKAAENYRKSKGGKSAAPARKK